MMKLGFGRYAWRGERGLALVMALVALALGLLVLPPMLSHVSTSLSASQSAEHNLQEQYSSDAGAEYGLWKLENDAGFRDQLETAGPAGITITMPSQVNSLSPVVRVAKAAQELHYAMWGNSTYCTTNVEWTGSGNVINGDMHTNTGLRLIGNGNTLNGAVEYVTDIQVSGSTIYNPPPPHNPVQTYVQPMPKEWYMSDYDDPSAVGTPAYMAAQAGQYHYVDGDLQINSPEELLDGLYYVTGDIHINGNDLVGNVTFVARGLIQTNGANNSITPYCDQLVYFTDFAYSDSQRCSKPVIKISGTGTTSLGGVTYAPNGQIAISGSGNMFGSFLGDSIDLAGSGLTMNLPPPIGYPSGCTAYDVLSSVGDTSTAVRVLYCEGNFQVVSWSIQ